VRRSVRLRALVALLVAPLLVREAFAAPLPAAVTHRGAAATRAAASFRALPAAADALGACGTNVDAIGPALADAIGRPRVAPLATPLSMDTNGIAVLEDDGTFFYADKDGHVLMDIAAVARAFYATHDDHYDFLAVYLASGMTQWLGSPGALAAAWVLRNDTQGLGLSIFDIGQAMGSPSRLQSFLTMNALSRYPDDPDAPIGGPGDTFSTMAVIAHEFGHRWLAYPYVDSAGTATPALLGRDDQHWNFFFDCDSSFMEGCDWARLPADSFVTDGVTSTFGALDQYLMGLRSRAEMDSFFVVNDPQNIQPPGIYSPAAIPEVGVGCDGRATWWKLSDIEAVEGVRTPDASVSPKSWRVGFVLVVPRDTAATAADLAKLNVVRARFPQTIAASTWYRGSVDCTLDSRAGSVAIAHRPLHDTEDLTTPRTVAAQVTIVAAGIPLTVDPASVMLHWRSGTVGGFQVVPMGATAPDSFAASLPGPGAPGIVQYWLSASSDSSGIGAQLPAAGGDAPFQFAVGPDVTPPTVLHVAVPVQGHDRMPQPLLARVTDNVGVDSVWFESSVDGAPVTAQAVTPAGCDSFTVSVGAGLSSGHRVAYRFVARDRSAAGNIAYSNDLFDTLRVTQDWQDDFENPVNNYSHGPVLWSGRDPWHLDTRDSSPPGGTSWHCGSTDGTPYEPHVDAALTTPYVYGVVSGTTFTFDERHQLEQETGSLAFDAARVELEETNGPWVAVEPSPGYTHTEDEDGLAFPLGSACWSGGSQGWVRRTVDLSPYAPGPLRLRIRMCSDDLVGEDGLWVDRVRVSYPSETILGVEPDVTSLVVGPPWPNPCRGALRVALALPRTARVEWTLHDVQGRRVATLWSGPAAAGRSQLAVDAPHELPDGLYFARVRIDGQVRSTTRIALLR